jgi:endonuclease/exonuclease/phosphatase family metal-dependent hydrolase
MAKATAVPQQEGVGPMPEEVVDEVLGLRAALRASLPAKSLDRTLVIGTWNIRAFGDLEDAWAAGPKAKVKRDRRALALITEIVSHFDVVAVQEVKGNLRALRHMMKTLGPDWSFILTDVTEGSAGNDERLAFVFDTRRVRLSGLAGELVIPDEVLQAAGAGELRRQFARTPYAVSFISGGRTFILVTLHVLWGKVSKDRLPELRGIAAWARGWAEEIASWGQNLIVLGDFNIDRLGDETFEAFTESGLHPPPELNEVPRTVFAGKEGGFYDQVAWFEKGGSPLLTLRYTGQAGGFDFVPFTFPELDRQQLSWRMSDHFPLWCEFSVIRESDAVSPPSPARSPSSPRGRRPRR